MLKLEKIDFSDGDTTEIHWLYQGRRSTDHKKVLAEYIFFKDEEETYFRHSISVDGEECSEWKQEKDYEKVFQTILDVVMNGTNE